MGSSGQFVREFTCRAAAFRLTWSRFAFPPSGVIHDTIKSRLRASLLLTPPPKSGHAAALHHAATLRTNGSWEDLVAPASLPPGSDKPPHLERTLLLAKAHRAAVGALEDPLRRALDFWLSNDPISSDWRCHQIVIPRLVGEIALLCDQSLSAGAADKVLEILARARWANWVAASGWVECTGIELLGIAYNHLLRGCLESAPTFFDAAFRRVFREFRPADGEGGSIQPDMTFHAPGGTLAGDGLVFIRECAQFIALAHGTPWQAPAEAVKLFVAFLLDGQQWIMRPGTVDAASPNDVFTEAVDIEGISLVVQQLAQLGNPPRRSELAAFARRLQGRGEVISGHRYFWRARMSVHQRPAFYASLRLSPSPCADGRAYFLRSGREYHGLDLPATDQAPPGSTTFCDTDHLPPESAVVRDGYVSGFLSGAVSEGDCGMAAIELRRPSLRGKKAWFFFDESVVCLGTGLHSMFADRRVCTTINHGRLQGPVTARSVDGVSRLLPPENARNLTSVSALEHDGFSYVFPAPAALVADFSHPAPANPDGPAAPPPAFRLRIDHGTQPQGVSWACIVLPTGHDPESAARTADEVDRLEILANTPALQAVRHRDLGLLAAAFWEPGTVSLANGGRVAANHTCVLLCRELPGGGTRLGISTLSNQSAVVHVEYAGQCVAFELPGGVDAGRSMSRLL